MHTRSLEVAAEHDAGGPPERSLEQRLAALARANTVRTARAELKRELKRLDRHAIALVVDVVRKPGAVAVERAEPEHVFDTMRLFDLLLATPGFGRIKATRLLNRLRVSPSKTLIGLSDRQRDESVEELQAFARMTGRLAERPAPSLLDERTAA